MDDENERCPKMTFSEMARRYCDRQEQIPIGLLDIFQNQKKRFDNVGWFLLECVDMSSSMMGSLVILPYGGADNTFKTIPEHPVSPRGLASDMSTACGYILASELPATLPDDIKDWQPLPSKDANKTVDEFGATQEDRDELRKQGIAWGD